jgi:hypothetical protein
MMDVGPTQKRADSRHEGDPFIVYDTTRTSRYSNALTPDAVRRYTLRRSNQAPQARLAKPIAPKPVA